MPGGKVAVRDASNTITQIATRSDTSAGDEIQLIAMDALAQSDGHSATVGAKADSAWGGSGAGSVVALLKDIALSLRGGIVTAISGSVGTTTAAGAEADGHSLTLGAKADAAWSGSGAGGVVSLLKDAGLQFRALITLITDVHHVASTALKVVNVDGSKVSIQFAEDTAHVSGDVGTMVFAVRSDAAGSLSSVTGNYTPLQCDELGQLRVAPGQLVAQAASVARVAALTTSATVLAANLQRTGAKFMNDSNAMCYVLEGSGTASSTNFSVKLAPNDANGIGGYYETPFGFTGAVQAVWTAATGALAVTETS